MVRFRSAVVVLILLGAAGFQALAAQKPLGRPIATIGTVDGDPSEVLFGAFSADRLSDGRIVLVNSGTSEVRIYDARGKHQKTIGRKGDGPGEFRGLLRLGVIHGDTILAYDWHLLRVTWLAPNGDFIRTVRVQPFENGPPVISGFLDDGRMFIRSDFNRIFSRGERRDSVVFGLMDRSGKVVQLFGKYPGQEEFHIATPEMSTRLPVRFGRDVFGDGNGMRMVAGTNDQFKLNLLHGAPRVITDPKVEQARVKPEDIKAWNDQRIAGTHERTRKLIESRLGDVPTRPTHTAFSGLLVGSDGMIWTGSADIPKKPRVWTGRDDSGAVKRSYTLPTGAEPIAFGLDWMLTRVRDADGVEYLHLYALN